MNSTFGNKSPHHCVHVRAFLSRSFISPQQTLSLSCLSFCGLVVIYRMHLTERHTTTTALDSASFNVTGCVTVRFYISTVFIIANERPQHQPV